MNCSIHQDVVAVASCGKCGVAMCNDCLETSEYNINDVALCRKCNYAIIQDQLASDKTSRVWLYVKIIISAVLVLLGAFTYFDTGQYDGLIFAWGISGFFTGWKLTSGNARTRAEDKLDDAIAEAKSAGGGVSNSLTRFVIRIVVAFLVGVVAAPILLIVNIVKLTKTYKSIASHEEMLLAFA